MEATNAPIEPFDGLLKEGRVGFDGRESEELRVRSDVVETDCSDVSPAVGSIAAIAFSKPAQPSWLSTASGS